MLLTQEQLDRFDHDGFLILPDVFSVDEVETLRQAMPALMAAAGSENGREADGRTVRNVFGVHRRDRHFADLTHHPRLLGPARQILGEDFYVQQCKVNVKDAFIGDGFDWHTDFHTHHSRDGVPKPLALNLHVFLDDVTEFNGPLWFVPGSHRMDVPAVRDVDGEKWELWTVPRSAVKAAIDRAGLVSAVGRRGTVLIFGDQLLHGSPENISPWSRWIYSVIVNPMSNQPTKKNLPRNQHEQDFVPMMPVADDCLRPAA
ncbi:MAG: phytanoyl-CoA dioxygenase family protein [Alphaproteobacteria bacterium]|nr:phytanoyl-CoA dioxygenase family protein [Alphaproteobacteria bacterium]